MDVYRYEPPCQDPEIARAIYALRSVPPRYVSGVIKAVHFVHTGEDNKALGILRGIPEDVKKRMFSDLKDVYGDPAPGAGVPV